MAKTPINVTKGWQHVYGYGLLPVIYVTSTPSPNYILGEKHISTHGSWALAVEAAKRFAAEHGWEYIQ